MSWLPISNTHAVETMILEVNFENAFNKRDFSNLILESRDKIKSMGFNTYEPISGFEAYIYDSPRMKSFSRETANDGILLREISDGEIHEEIGLHIWRFHYLTNNYVRWSLTKNRIVESMSPVLARALELNQVQDISIIYWNKFLHKGSQTQGNFSIFSEKIRELLPPNPFEDRINWSYDFNWIKEGETSLLSVGQGIDFNNHFKSDQYVKSEISINLKVKQEPIDLSIDKDNFSNILEQLYSQSVDVLGASLSLEGQKLIGINSQEKQNLKQS